MKLFLITFLFSFQIFADQNQTEFDISGLYRKNKIVEKDQYNAIMTKKDVDLYVSKNSPWGHACGNVAYSFHYPSIDFPGVSTPYLDTFGGNDFYDFMKSKKASCTQIQKNMIKAKDSISLQVNTIVKFNNYTGFYTYSKLRVKTEIKKITNDGFSLFQTAELFCDEKEISKEDCEAVYIKRNLEIEAYRN